MCSDCVALQRCRGHNVTKDKSIYIHKGLFHLRILYDASQQPVVMATVPNLKCFLRDGGSSLFVLPQRVKL